MINNLKFYIIMGVLALFGGLQGCTTNPTTGEKVFTGGVTVAEESRLGREQHPGVVQYFGGEYGSPKLKAYINRVGQKLARHVERKNFQYRFTLLNSSTVNALAAPGGYLYVTRGLLAMADDEAELAGVLAHELGHVTALHYVRSQGSSVIANILTAGLGIALGEGAGQLGGFVGQGVLASHGREHELESDSLALRYLARAGYDPNGMVRFLRKMRAEDQFQIKQMGGSPDQVDQTGYLSTHPATVERLRKAQEQVAQYNVRNPIVGKDRYLNQIDGILYGDDPDQGFVRGRAFVHPKLRFRFEIPRGFSLQNTPNEVQGSSADGSAFIFSLADKIFRGPMTSYVSQVSVGNGRLSRVERLTINGMDAATGIGKGRTQQGHVDIRLVAIRMSPQHIYQFLFITPESRTSRHTAAFRQTAFSFRELTASEARALKPLRIRVVQAGSGDTVQSLSKRMAVDQAFAEEKFRLINGLDSSEGIRAGQRLKLITE